jgi:nucleoside permease NupC
LNNVQGLNHWLQARWVQLACLGGVLALGGLAWLLRGSLGQRGVALFGALCFLGLCFALSKAPLRVKPRTVVTGLVLQIGLALLVCGFANLSSLGIQIGGIGGLVPSRRDDLAKLSLLALAGGSLVTLINAAVAGVLLPVS